MALRPRHRSLATPVALLYALLVLYASLYPFTAWRWPPGHALGGLLWLPWPPWRVPFDEWSNLAGYLPLGLLATLAARRSGLGWAATFAAGVLAPMALSYGCEVLQQFAPTRHPSLRDFALNAAGAAAGCVVALLLIALGLADRWQRLRTRWFGARGRGALALLGLWPVALLFPSPVPLGIGQVHDLLRDELAALLAGRPWAAALHDALAVRPARDADPTAIAEATITALGLLAPCLVAFTVVLPPRRRVVMLIGAVTLAAGTLTLATLLNFGPAHAFAWVGRATLPAFAAGTLIALLLAPLPRPLVAGCGLLALGALIAAVAQAPADPYFAQSLQAWEQGRFVRFHGLAQWVGWCWPYAAMLWFLTQLGPRHEAAR